MRNVLSHVLAAVVSLIPLCAQEPLADGVTSFLGGGSLTAWFEKGGTVWVTDGTVRGTRDTGVPTGNYSLATDRLIVYRQNRIDRMNPDGSTTTLTPPVAFDGYDDDAPEPTVWRAILRRSDAEFLEVWRWSNSWRSQVAGVRSGSGRGDLLGVYPRAGRYLVQWMDDRPSERLSDLLSDSWHSSWSIVGLDANARRPIAWSSGLLFDGSHQYVNDRVLAVVDRGPVITCYWPTSWSAGGGHSFAVREPSTGFPFIDHGALTQSLTFLTSTHLPFDRAPGVVASLLWTVPDEEILALVEQFGTRDVLWLDRATNVWSPASGFGAPTAIDFVGNHDGATYLAVSHTNGTSLIAYDETTHAATTMVSGLAAIPRGVAPFANGFVFTADDGVHGVEPWICDGTPNGTRMIADLRAGSAGSEPREFVRLGERQVFAADSAAGTQVWSIEPQQLAWKRNPTNGRFYRLTSPSSWISARTDARNLGGELATIRDAAEQDWLTSTFGPANLWIGLSDFDRDGNFEWASGEPTSFTNWCPGQPDRLPGETAVHLSNYPGYCVAGWNDQDPLDSYCGIAERGSPPHPVEEIGVGCSPGFPQPVASAQWTGGFPRPGATVNFEFVLGSRDYSVGVLFLSVDATAFGGTPLPMDLSIIGAPGCTLYVRPDDTIAQWGGEFGFPLWAMPAALRLPNDPVLRGAVLFLQALAFEAYQFSAPRTTNALRITIGS